MRTDMIAQGTRGSYFNNVESVYVAPVLSRSSHNALFSNQDDVLANSFDKTVILRGTDALRRGRTKSKVVSQKLY